MAEIALAKLTRKGQVTIPKALRDKLGIEPGDFLTARRLMGGILIAQATVTPHGQAEDVLRSLMSHLGQAAEQQGIREEEDLEPLVEDAQRRAYQNATADDPEGAEVLQRCPDVVRNLPSQDDGLQPRGPLGNRAAVVKSGASVLGPVRRGLLITDGSSLSVAS